MQLLLQLTYDSRPLADGGDRASVSARERHQQGSWSRLEGCLCWGLYEEYAERCWDLWFGREGSEHQGATPVHLSSGLTGAAYSAVRKLDHPSLIVRKAVTASPPTKDSDSCSRPRRTTSSRRPRSRRTELFFQAFYSPHVWCMQAETMQQYILRREQDFKRLDTSGL